MVAKVDKDRQGQMEQTDGWPVEEMFFKLIRLAIGTCQDRHVMLDQDGWSAVFDMACKQAMVAVVLDGVELLPAEQRPPAAVLMPWIGMVQRIEAQNRKLNHAVIRICERFRQEGKTAILLKGQGNAVWYPRPLHRMSGDIDLWIDGRREDLVRYVRRYTPQVDVFYHHVDFPVLKDISIELHFTPSWMNHWRMNRRLQLYFQQWHKESALHKVALPEGAGETAVPVLAMNRVYLLVHIYRHLFDEGIGVRQLLDYYFALIQPCTAEERLETLHILCQLRMKRFAAAMMYVLQHVFGLEDRFLLLPPSTKSGKRLLDEVMLAGNFGQYDSRICHTADETPFRRFRRKVARNLHFLEDYPHEVIWSPLFKIWHYVWRRYHGYWPIAVADKSE